MPRIKAETKERRKERIWMLVRQHNGIRQIELADLSGFDNRTVNNYLNELEYEGKVYKEGVLWFEQEFKKMELRRFEMHPEEAYTLYLAARLFVKQSDKRNEYAETALYRLAEVLKSDVPVSPNIQEAARKLAEREDQPGYHDIFQTLIRAYLRRQKVRLIYKPLWRDSFETTFEIYLIEPSAIGFSTYVIGYSFLTGGLRSYKLSRIESVEVLQDDTYAIPEEFPGLSIFDTAWSIITGEETTRVLLRFSDRVAARVLETNWHPSQDHEWDEEKPGFLRWWVDVADTTDISPWIRGWGADVEVLGPEKLREAVMQTSRDLGKIYQTMTTTTKLLYHLPYAKTNPDNPRQIHLLLYHLIDVGQVARLIWREVLTDSIRQRLAGMLDLNVEEAGQFIAFLAALHDLGKAGPAYQQKYAPDWLKAELTAAGLILKHETHYSLKTQDPKTPHAIVSTWALQRLLPELLHLERRFAYKIALALGGHHGSWPTSGAMNNIDDGKYPLWEALRRDLFWEVRATFRPPTAVSPPADRTDLNTFLTIFSGLVSVADWVGSRNKECFGFVDQAMSTRQYAHRSAEKARRSLEDLGWFGWQPAGDAPDFGEVFAYLNFKAPRGVQAEVIEKANNSTAPGLLILEAPTGIGKTEAALYLAYSWLQQHAGRGLYVAMPTQATSNQMYGRIKAFLAQRYPDQPVNLHLVHGQAAWQDALKKQIELQTVGDDDRAATVQAESWFTPRKRTLLAPFGVGTVDQTFLSILQTKHFFVRLFGLSHKVVIFDEVHAYDTFMSTLFERLLTWLNAIGASVIILSATLPAETRRKLVKAYSGQRLTESGSYPSLTIAASDQKPAIIDLSKPPDVTVQVAWDVGREPSDILAYLVRELADGGCAAVICNTVRRAQEIYRALDEARQSGKLDSPADDLILFHARFPPIWRREIEQTVLDKFGKPGNGTLRPHKAIVVATQVIEQSLDLDFDLMVTDMAPIDLVIQRAGRLHRHERSAEARHGLPQRLVITEPAEMGEDGLPKFDVDEYVYARSVLLRSYYALKAQGSTATFPTDTTSLIEQVYGDLSLLPGLSEMQVEGIKAAEKKMREDDREARQKAKSQLILEPKKSRLLDQAVAGLEEDNPDVHRTFRAQTRDIDAGISLVCLHRQDGRLFIHTEAGELDINLSETIPFQQIKQIQQNIITVQHKALFRHFIDEKPPPGWQKQAALRHCRTVIFEKGVYSGVPNYLLKLTKTFGLETKKQEDA